MRKLFCVVAIVLVVALLSGCGIRRKKYETPIVSDSLQPDKTLFDKAVNDIERSRYEVARLTLQTLINTYPDSEYLARAKLAIGDAFYREGGTASLVQAEAEYKDFITFFPTMPEAAEAQLKVSMIHYQQMEKASRDTTHALRAEDEFRQLLLQFPDSPFKEEAQQRLREVQEVLGEHEFGVGEQYYIKGNPRAAIPRLKEVVDNYPNYSKADEALYMVAQMYEKGGKEFRPYAAAYYSRIISDYPLSKHADEAREKLGDWKMPIPEAKPEAIARMKYDLEHRQERGFWGKTWGVFSKRPDVSTASKAGQPVLLPPPRTAGEVLQPTAVPGAMGLGVTVVPSGETPGGAAGATAPAPPPQKPPENDPGGAASAAQPAGAATQAAGDTKQPDQAAADKSSAKKDQAKKDQAKKDKAKEDQAKKDQAKKDKAKEDQAKKDRAKEDQAKKDQAKKDKNNKDAKDATKDNGKGKDNPAN
jgi:outer membrane protein assembly factor BamD